MTFSKRLLTLVAATAAALALTAAPSMAVVGGSDAAPGEYPSVAEVTIAQAFLCTGTLIAPNYVLTAGHCGSITGGSGVASPAGWPAAAIDVRIGSNKPGQGEKVPVSSVTVEPNYLANSGYDITLLKLSKNSTKTPTHVVGASGASLWAPSTLEEIVGFGTTSEGGDTPDTLQKAKVPVTTDAYCAGAYDDFDATTMLCAGLPAGRHRHLPGRLRRPDVRPRRLRRAQGRRRDELRRGLRAARQARCLRPRGRLGLARVDSLGGACGRRLTEREDADARVALVIAPGVG